MGEIISLRPYHLLLVEDSASEAELLSEVLSPSIYGECVLTHVETIEAALLALKEDSFHLALLDLSLPDAIELSGLIAIQNTAPMLPVIILTANKNKELALKAVEIGAQDYLVKDDVQTQDLYRAIQYAIQRKRFESDLIIQANFDKLTGLANRTLFESRLNMAFARVRRNLQGLALFYLDLNKFKEVNDRYGHATGDAVLKEAAMRIKLCLRPYDTSARLGGDEFAVLLEGVENPRDCAAIAQKIIHSLSQPIDFKSITLDIGISIGIANYFRDDRLTPELLMQYADEAMYRAKQHPSSYYAFYTAAFHEEMLQRTQLERDLLRAIRENELILYYQPKVSLQTNQIVGVEALVRWNHPERGILLPGEFTAIAEEIKIMAEIGEWVIENVCKDLNRWYAMNFSPVQVSINLSAAQLDDMHFADNVREILAKEGIGSEYLAFEIPEEVLLRNTEQRSAVMSQLRQIGVDIHLDRFGEGNIPIHMLLHPSLNALKIDFAGMTNLEMQHPEFFARIEALMSIARPLGLKVIASGVENRWQQTYLKDQAYDQAQGFAVARPMLPDDLCRWLQSSQKAMPGN